MWMSEYETFGSAMYLIVNTRIKLLCEQVRMQNE